MSRICKGIESCPRKACIENDRCCYSSFVAKMEAKRGIVIPTREEVLKERAIRKAAKAKRTAAKMQRLVKSNHRDANADHTRVWDMLARLRQEGVKGQCGHVSQCNKQKVCSMLAQCVLTHARVIAVPGMIDRMRAANTTKKAIALMAEMMPSLQLIGVRYFYRPESSFAKTIITPDHQLECPKVP